MANPETTTYETESLIAGNVKTRDDAPLAADTYYRGMPLSIVPTVTAGGSDTGNGTCVVISKKQSTPDITLTMTAALIAKITVNSVDVITGIALPDGGNVVIIYDGVEIVLTDGGTAFVADDSFVISFDDGAFAYDIVNPQVIYSGTDARVLSSPGVGSIITEGEVLEAGIVDDAGSALTIGEGLKQAAASNGIYIK